MWGHGKPRRFHIFNFVHSDSRSKEEPELGFLFQKRIFRIIDRWGKILVPAGHEYIVSDSREELKLYLKPAGSRKELSSGEWSLYLALP